MRRLMLVIGWFFACNAYAQNYTRDAGIRIGDFMSAGYRQFVDENQAIEGMVSGSSRGLKITIMKEHFQQTLGHVSGNLYFQYGYGVHVGFRYINHYKVLNRTYALDDYRFTPLLGLDGMVGIEYRFPDFPFIVGMDIKPFFEYSTIQIFNLYLNSVGISIKYRF